MKEEAAVADFDEKWFKPSEKRATDVCIKAQEDLDVQNIRSSIKFTIRALN